MTRSWFLAAALAATAVTCAACGGNSGGTGSGGGGGAATSSTSTTTSSTGTTSSTTSGTTSSTGTETSTSCDDDPTNPMFTSCIVPFLAGCWAPDLSGTCIDANGTTSWSDGSKYVTQGAMPGIYGPGDTTPCISMVIANGTITGTKGTEVIKFESVPGTQMAKITCPDQSTFTATDDQVTAFNTCKGLNCPPLTP